MSKTICFILLSLISFDLNDIAKINSLKKKGEEAFKNGNYEEAQKHYSFLLDSMGVTDEAATMNYAHAQYKTGNVQAAQNNYQKLVLSKDPQIKSLAYQQLGVLSNDPKTLERTLSYFKESIKSNPANEDARYNYELIKKKLKDQQEKGENNDQQDKDDQENKDEQNKDKGDQKNQDQQNKDQEGEENKDQENKDQEGEENKDEQGKEDEQKPSEENKPKEGDPKQDPKEDPAQKPGEEEKEGDDKKPPVPSRSQKLEDMNISEEKAKMILEALRNSEIQYIQQNRRKPTKSQDSGKPDW